MPVVILLDVSLSMSRPVPVTDGTAEVSRRQLAVQAINQLLDHMEQNCRLEFVSLIIYSALWETKVAFTRDYDDIRTALNHLQDYSKTNLIPALSAAKSLIIDEWGVRTQSQILLFTDESIGAGPSSLKAIMQQPDAVPLPFDFPCRLNIVCLASSKDRSFESAIQLYNRLIALNDNEGSVITPDSVLCQPSVKSMVENLSKTQFKPFHGTLKCGHLASEVLLHPRPEAYEADHDYSVVKKIPSPEMNICGYLDINDASSPPFISRHLVLPLPSKTTESDQEPGKEDVPAFTVLLHGALKVENMISLVEIGDDWYGMMYSWADSKKKSNLMLSVFKPGSDIIPWLGQLKHLAPLHDFSSSPYNEEGTKTPFPVRPAERRSYAQNCVVWIKPSGLQADLQKILRNARKLPEKQQHFYKELNRLRRAALSFGFYDLLESMSQLLERERSQLPSNAHPDASYQLTHAISMLRNQKSRTFSLNIQPLKSSSAE